MIILVVPSDKPNFRNRICRNILIKLSKIDFEIVYLNLKSKVTDRRGPGFGYKHGKRTKRTFCYLLFPKYIPERYRTDSFSLYSLYSKRK